MRKCIQKVMTEFRLLPDCKQFHEDVAKGRKDRRIMVIYVGPGEIGESFTPENVKNHLDKRIELEMKDLSTTSNLFPWLTKQDQIILLEYIGQYNPRIDTIWTFLFSKPNGTTHIKHIIANTNPDESHVK